MAVRALALVMVVASSGSALADPAVFHCKPGVAGCLDGEVIGVVAAFGWDYDGKRDRLIRNDEPRFELGVGDIDREPRFPAPNQPVELPATDGSGAKVLAKSSYIQRSDGEAYGIKGDARLVRIRVNAGRGSAPGQRDFHAELIETLDTTAAYPLDVSKLLHATLEPFETARTKQGKRWRTLLRAAALAAAKADKSGSLEVYDKPGEDISAGIRATWIADSQTFRIVFSAELGRSYAKRVKPPADARYNRCDDDPLDCSEPPVMRPKYLITSRTYTASYAITLDFDKTGKLIATRELPVAVASPTMSTHNPF